MKKSVCFVDDDEDEIKRFRDNLEHHYILGTGTTLTAALDDLKDRGVSKPDLVLLDLYFGPRPNEEKRREMLKADVELAKWSIKSVSCLSHRASHLKKDLDSQMKRQSGVRVFLVLFSVVRPTWRTRCERTM